MTLPFPTANGSCQELDPRVLRLSEDAREILVNYANAVEKGQRLGSPLERIRATASKSPEQAARIAAVMTVFIDEHAEEVSGEVMTDAVELAKWYLGEALRILDMGEISELIQQAEVLRAWLVERWSHDHVNVRSIVRLGPNEIRDTMLVRRLIKVLEQNRWLVGTTEAVLIDGKQVREAWHVVRE